MFLLTILIISIVTMLIFIQNIKGKDNPLFQAIAALCFAFSGVTLVMWFTILIEGWQIALGTPASSWQSLSGGERAIQMVQRIVFLLPVSRLALGALYTSPIIVIPLALAARKRSQATSIILHATLLNLLFFWTQLIIDEWIRASITSIPLQSVVLVASYGLVLYLLITGHKLRGVT